jgi:hypothetical protein
MEQADGGRTRPSLDITIDGDIAARDCLLKYKSNGLVLTVASIYRELAKPSG